MRVVIQISLLIWGFLALGISLHMLEKSKRLYEGAETANGDRKKLIEENERLQRELSEAKPTLKQALEIDVLKSEIERQKKQLKGERVCDGYCKHCKHAFKAEMFSPNGWYSGYKCGLDCKCQDFEKKEEADGIDDESLAAEVTEKVFRKLEIERIKRQNDRLVMGTCNHFRPPFPY